MATGENFRRIAGNSMADIKNLENQLLEAQIKFTNYAKNADENWNWDTLNELEKRIENLNYQLECTRYEDDRRRNWK